MIYPYKVVMRVKDSNGNTMVYEDYGRTQDESLFVRTAERVLREIAKIDSNKFVAINVEHLSIDKIPQEFKAGWPKGLKSILVYNYEYKA